MPVNTVELSLLTIVAESLLRERLIGDLRRAGARGYTLTEAEGEGSRHRRVGEILGANIKLETVVSAEVADRLLAVLAADYFPSYAVIAYVTPVSVVRGDKYV